MISSEKGRGVAHNPRIYGRAVEYGVPINDIGQKKLPAKTFARRVGCGHAGLAYALADGEAEQMGCMCGRRSIPVLHRGWVIRRI